MWTIPSLVGLQYNVMEGACGIQARKIVQQGWSTSGWKRVAGVDDADGGGGDDGGGDDDDGGGGGDDDSDDDSKHFFSAIYLLHLD